MIIIKWYWLWLIFGGIVGFLLYFGSIKYKLDHPEYHNSKGKRFSWKMLFGFIATTVIWPVIVIASGTSIVQGEHQRLETLKSLEKINMTIHKVEGRD